MLDEQNKIVNDLRNKINPRSSQGGENALPSRGQGFQMSFDALEQELFTV